MSVGKQGRREIALEVFYKGVSRKGFDMTLVAAAASLAGLPMSCQARGLWDLTSASHGTKFPIHEAFAPKVMGEHREVVMNDGAPEPRRVSARTPENDC